MYRARVVLLSICIVCLCASLGKSQSPLSKVFEPTFEELTEAFNSHQVMDEEAGREILLYEVTYDFDDKGLLKKSTRTIWKIRQNALAQLGTVECEFSPWYQKQPVVRARVFDRNGKVYELDKEDLTVTPSQSHDPQVLTNDLVVRAALPGLQDGAIVEQLIVEEEQSPYFADGRYYLEVLDSFESLAFHSIEINAPSSLPIQLVQLGEAIPFEKSVSDRSVRYRFELSGRKKRDVSSVETYAPPGTYTLNRVAINLGGTWEDIAEGYSKIIDRKIGDTQFAPLIKEVIPTEAKTKLEMLQASAQWVKKNIRYTGLALGAASIVPASPMQLVARRFGDCKDQATFLVGILRELGIEAHVALVNATGVHFPDQRLPGLNAFDHAIAVASIDGQQYWIDCTSLGSTTDNLPAYLQGKNVLIAARRQSLTQIPLSSPEVNSREDEKEFRLQSSDLTLTVTTKETYGGFNAVPARELAISQTTEQTEKYFTEMLRQESPQSAFRILKQDDPWSLDSKFVRVTEISGAPLEEIDYTTHRTVIKIARLFDLLPQAFLLQPREENQAVSRQLPASISTPFLIRRKYRIRAPEGWELQAKVGKQSTRIGDVTLLRESSEEVDGSISVLLELRAEASELTVDQLKLLYDVVKRLDDPSSEWNVAVTFREKQSTETLSVAQQIQKAKHSWEIDKSAESLHEYVLLLLEYALIDEARLVASKAVQSNPTDALTLITKGLTESVDHCGRLHYPGMNRQAAERDFQEAIKADPKNMRAYHELAILAFRDLDSTTRDDVEGAKQCLKIIDDCMAKAGNMTMKMRDLQIGSLVVLDRISEAITVADGYRLDRIALALRLFDSAKNSRWKEVKRLREQIGTDRELKKFVIELVRGFLVEKRLYTSAAEFLENTADPDEKELLALAKSYRAVSPVDADSTPTASPDRVALELIRRVYLSGIQFDRWDDIIQNPGVSHPALENSLCLEAIADLRNLFRFRLADRVSVANTVRTKFIVDGDDNTGFRCRLDKGPIRLGIFVTKQESGYKVLLAGKNSEQLVEHAKQLASQGNIEGAVQWINWHMDELSEVNLLVPESGSPIKKLWMLSRKKTPELVDQTLRMMTSWNGKIDDRHAETVAWIDAEKSKARQMLLWQYMLESLWQNRSAKFIDEAKRFLQLHPSFTVTRTLLIMELLKEGRIEDARAVFNEATAQFSSTRRAEVQRLVNQSRGEFSKNIPALKKRVEQESSFSTWNSLLWESLFADEMSIDLVKEATRPIVAVQEPLSLHTLACAEAKVGSIKEAVADLKKLCEIQGERIQSADWLIVGLIAEDCSHWDAAIRAYEKVQAKDYGASLTGAYELAQIRIREVRKKQNPPAAADKNNVPQ